MRLTKIRFFIFLALWAFTASAWSGEAETDITFVVASDLHYYGTTPNTAMHKYIDRLNALPGTDYPASVGGKVKPFQAVILNGDLTDKGTEVEWKLFADDWGLLGEKRCKFPLYEGFGNHDYRGDNIVRDRIKERNKLRKDLANVSAGGLHYSWEMGGIHFIQANLVAADKGRLDPGAALTFVKSDLEKCVGDSGRPVILNHHYSATGSLAKEFAPAEQRALADALAKYNVIGLFCGHSHGYMIVDGKRLPNPNYEREKFPGSNIDQYDDGSLRDDGARPKWKESGRFFVVRIQGAAMTVIMNTPAGWGQPHTKAISYHAEPATQELKQRNQPQKESRHDRD